MSSAPSIDAEPRTTASRAQRQYRVAVTGIFAGVALATLAALLLPLFAALDPGRATLVRLGALALGACVAIAVVVLGPSGEPPGARLGTRVGSIIAATGIIVGVTGAISTLLVGSQLGIPFERATAASLGSGAIGLSMVVATIAGAATAITGSESLPSSGVSLRFLISGATGTITLATWALATAHLLGHFSAIGRQTAVEEARDLVLLVDSMSTGEMERHAAALAPPGGFLGRIDGNGRVVSDVAIGLLRDAVVHIDEGPPTTCRVSGQRRAIPCATRALQDGTRAIAGVADLPVPTGLLFAFFVVGAAAATVAFSIGARLSRGPGGDLDRIAAVLNELGGAGQGGLDQPIPAVSLDEVGDLSVALARLRVRLRPGLVEHDEALARARAADEERDHFLALVSEELRAPLDRILGASRDLLEGNEPLTAAQREDVRLIVNSSTHLTELIEEVLDLSAIATGQVQLRIGDVDLAAIVSEVGRAQRPLLGNRPVEMRIVVPEGGARVRGDERRLRQVVTNLVSNAVKFTAAGSITIGIEIAENDCVLTVADTGPGIAAEQLPKLFTEFVQLGTLRQRSRGTGLGLAICKRLIEAHGGSVHAESELGVGTRFHVRLPRTQGAS